MNILRIITGSTLNNNSKVSKILFNKLNIYLKKSSINIHNSTKEFKLPASSASRALARLKHRDGISQDYEIIYRSSLTRYVTYLYPTSIVMIVGGLYGSFLSFTNVEKVLDNYVVENLVISYQNKYELIFCYFTYYAVNLLMLWVCVKHPIRMYYNPDKNIYKMILINWRYPFKKIIEFTPEVVEKKYRNPWNALMQTSHSIHGKTYHIMQDSFRSKTDYIAMLGHKAYV